MKLNIVKSKNCTILHAARSYRSESGKSTSKVVKRLGTVEELRGKLNGEDPIEWAKAQVAGITALEKEGNKHVIIDRNPMALIPKGERRSYNGGYLSLQKIYYELGLDHICKKIARKHKLLKYDLIGILSMLVYTRILYPGAKRSSLEDARKFLEQPECALEQRVIVTFSFKYQEYLRHVRERQITRAKALLAKGRGATSKKKSPGDAKRFIKAGHVTADGELAQIENFPLNQQKRIDREGGFPPTSIYHKVRKNSKATNRPYSSLWP